jgi:hypothetical protein
MWKAPYSHLNFCLNREDGTLCIMFLKTAEECYVQGLGMELFWKFTHTHFNLFCFQFCDGNEHPKTDHTLIGNMFVEDH